MKWIWVAVPVLLAGCGGSSEAPAEPAEQRLEVQVQADQRGIGCFQSPVKGGDQLTVADADGTTIGTATFDKTPGSASCDWTATLTVPESDFYRLSTSEPLVTVKASEVAGGRVLLHVNTQGSVSVAS